MAVMSVNATSGNEEQLGIELDLENGGNPLGRHFESLLRVGREVARCALTAVLALMALAAIVTLQAAIQAHVYLWRLVG
jgi:hypothetical protein